MTLLIDGPAAGAYSVTRAPRYLRAVVREATATEVSRRDLLDQLDDTPEANETVYVYAMVGEASRGFICERGGRGGYQEWGNYRWRSDIDGETLRDTEAWRAWARAQIPTNGGPTFDPIDPAFDDLRGKPLPEHVRR